MTPKQLIVHANSLTTSFQETEREMQKSFRLKRDRALDLDDAGQKAQADALFDAADREEAELAKCRTAFYEANAEIDALLVSAAMVRVTNDVVDAKATEARGHMKRIKKVGDKLEALAAFTGFLVEVVALVATFRAL